MWQGHGQQSACCKWKRDLAIDCQLGLLRWLCFFPGRTALLEPARQREHRPLQPTTFCPAQESVFVGRFGRAGHLRLRYGTPQGRGRAR